MKEWTNKPTNQWISEHIEKKISQRKIINGDNDTTSNMIY